MCTNTVLYWGVETINIYLKITDCSFLLLFVFVFNSWCPTPHCATWTTHSDEQHSQIQFEVFCLITVSLSLELFLPAPSPNRGIMNISFWQKISHICDEFLQICSSCLVSNGKLWVKDLNYVQVIFNKSLYLFKKNYMNVLLIFKKLNQTTEETLSLDE